MIYIVRHGQTDGNVSKTLRGRVFDDQLNETGIQQATQVAKQLRGVKFDICYCSPMTRTRQTYEQISDCPVVTDQRILPLRYSDSLIGKDVATARDYHEFFMRTNKRFGDDAETILEFEKRVFEFMDEICRKHKKQNVLVCTHSTVCKIVKAYFFGLPKDNSYASIPGTKNCDIIKGYKKSLRGTR